VGTVAFSNCDTENYGIEWYNTGINTGQVYGGIPVFGITVLEALYLTELATVYFIGSSSEQV